MIKAPSYINYCVISFGLFLQPVNAEVIKENGRFSAFFKGMTIQNALKEIAENSDVRVVLSIPIDEEINVGFEGVTLEKIITSILKGYNYILIRDGSGNPSNLQVMSRKANAVELAAYVTENVKKTEKNIISGKTEELKDNSVVMVSLKGTEIKAIIDSGAPTSIISLVMAQKAKMLNADGSPAAAGDNIQVTNLKVNGRSVGKVSVIVIEGLPVDFIAGKEILDKSKPSKAGKAKPNSEPKPKKENRKDKEDVNTKKTFG